MASDHMVYDGMAESAVVPTMEGFTGILADHSNVIMAVVPGLLEYVPGGTEEEGRPVPDAGVRQSVVVSDGLIKAENGEVMILVDTAERPEDIDEARARRAEERAREELRKGKTAREHALANAELSRALSRIKASRVRHKF